MLGLGHYEATYRFFSNDKVSEDAILAGHFGSTLERTTAAEGTILVLHATEHNKPGAPPKIDWKLITDLPVTTCTTAIEKLHRYALLWPGRLASACVIARRDGVPLASADMWESWRDPFGEVLRTFTMATNAADGDVRYFVARTPNR